jgi:hypothetical protein
VWLRRVTHGLGVAVALAMLLLPAFSQGLGYRSRALSGIVGMLKPIIPSLFLPWTDWYIGYPPGLIIPGLLLALLLLTSTRLETSIHERMRSIWEAIVEHGPRPVAPDRAPFTRLYRFRTHPLYRQSAPIVSSHLLPLALGIVMFFTMLAVGGGTVNRAMFSVASAAGAVCRVDAFVASSVEDS